MNKTGLKEKAVKAIIDRGIPLYLYLEWDDHSKNYNVYVIMEDNKDKRPLLTWKGHQKAVRDDILLLNWAKSLGFKGIRWKDITF